MFCMDGLILIVKLWGLGSYLWIFIVMLIIEVGGDMKVKGKVVGVIGWMVKFFDFNKLFDVIKCVLG